MKIKKIVHVLLAGLVVMSLTGCASLVITGGADVDKTAFGPKKRFAVVSIASYKTIQAEKGLAQMFEDTDEIPGANTQPLLDAVKPKIIKSMAADRNISLMSERRVLSSRAYKKIAEDERKMSMMFFSDDINVAKNYKYLSEPQKYAKLAKELNVDGVIGVTMAFSIATDKGWLSINGLSLGRKAYSPQAMISAVAYDRDGNVIWKDNTMKRAEPGDKKAIFLFDFTDMTDTNYLKMHPKAIEIGGKAVEVLLARLDDTISGKGTSSIQSVE